MTASTFQTLPGETILYRAQANRKWYLLAWKVIIGILGISILTVIANNAFGSSLQILFASFVPNGIANALTQFLCLGLLPLLGLAWVVEDIVKVFTGEFILTDRRIWIKGSPYAWSQGETPLDDIVAMTVRHDAVFVRQKSTRKLQVHMITQGKLFVQAYEQLKGKPPSA